MKAKRRERGASLPETAIVIGVVLALLFGIMDFGKMMYTYAFVAQIAREGARWAIVRGSQCSLLDHCNASQTDLQTYVQSLSEGLTQPSSITVTETHGTCPPGSSGNAPGCQIGVAVSYQYKFTLIPYLASMPITMSSTSQMVISQ